MLAALTGRMMLSASKKSENAIGPDIELMADINQALEPKQAIQLGKKLEEYDLLWLEEPVASNNREGHAEVRKLIIYSNSFG